MSQGRKVLPGMIWDNVFPPYPIFWTEGGSACPQLIYICIFEPYIRIYMYVLVLSFSKVTGTILSENGSDNTYVFFNYGSSQ